MPSDQESTFWWSVKLFAGLCIGSALAWSLSNCYAEIACPTLVHPPEDLGLLQSPVDELELRGEWVARFGQLTTGSCSHIVQWLVRSDAETQASCGPINPTFVAMGLNHIAACLHVPHGCPVATVADKYQNTRSLRAHEAAHWYAECLWLDGQTAPPADAGGDYFHKNPAIWGPDGYEAAFAN